MGFEDYNYNAFNEHILLRDLEKEAAEKDEKLAKKQALIDPELGSDTEGAESETPTKPIVAPLHESHVEPFENNDPLQGIARVPGTYGKIAVLSEKSLEAIINLDYNHKSIGENEEVQKVVQTLQVLTGEIEKVSESASSIQASWKDSTRTDESDQNVTTIFFKEREIKKTMK